MKLKNLCVGTEVSITNKKSNYFRLIGKVIRIQKNINRVTVQFNDFSGSTTKDFMAHEITDI